MTRFIRGQRWVSQTEPELGLGTLTHADRRTIEIKFDAGECTRRYSLSAAPLSRITFSAGDTVRLKDGAEATISAVTEENGLYSYTAGKRIICETDLSGTLLVSKPQERLLAGLTDPVKLFTLRCRILAARAAYDASDAKGFLGGQVSLLPHQFYIAHTIARRFVRRVLLSDETGLGKTIEACLVLHKLLVSHKISRILIIVPPALVHQWFIELYRKFNLSFMIYSENYCRSIEQSQDSANPFLHHQLAIAGLDLLNNKKRQEQVLAAGWDMLVLDEAHHITDSEPVFNAVEKLAADIPGLMLLTATPEQMGLKNHFRHLRLIDPERYFDYNAFCKEAAHYEEAVALLKQKNISDPDFEHLLDAYGPGRVIFKNRRTILKGFPRRTCRMIPLQAGNDLIRQAGKTLLDPSGFPDIPSLDDPRIHCLVDLVHQKEKILVITRSKETAAAVETAVAGHIQVSLARFDESMTLMQRDRNAAFFARPDGARILVCSEIGSEGRNFQFVRHLFLFDLPDNPELLEQRIGRLDRIGQENDICIHTPYIKNSVYDVLAQWYEKGLGIFSHHVDGAGQLFSEFKHRLFTLLEDAAGSGRVNQEQLNGLIYDTRQRCRTVKESRDKGRNLLLEFNSFRPRAAQGIIDTIQQADTENRPADLLTRVWDHYGIEADFFSSSAFTLNTDAMTDPEFPVPDHPLSAMTFDRSEAVARDELDLVTWDHVFVHRTLDYFITNTTGVCALARIEGAPAPGLLLETVYTVACIAPPGLNMEQFIRLAPVRILVDHHGRQSDLGDDMDAFSKQLQPDTPAWLKDAAHITREVVPTMIAACGKIAAAELEGVIKAGEKRITHLLGHEIDRLITLKQINPGIRDQEIRAAETQMAERLAYLSQTRFKLDALCLIRLAC